jgi:hypothetical protein
MQIILAFLFFVARPLSEATSFRSGMFGSLVTGEGYQTEYRELPSMRGGFLIARAVCSSGVCYVASSWRGVI